MPFPDGLMIGAAFAAMCAFFLTYQRLKLRKERGMKLQIAVKCAATAMAALVALTGCIRNGSPAKWVLLAGLIACTVADGVLCVHFVAGGAVFALGHILYMISFCMTRRPGWRSAIVFLCMAGTAAAGLAWFRARFGRAALLCFAYAVILSLMVSLAVNQSRLFFFGAVLFAVSDGMLAYLLVRGENRSLDYASLALYYSGQFLLGLAVYCA